MSKELERLTNEYDAVLIQYKKAKADISGAKSGTKSGAKELFKGQQIMGGQALGETDAKSAEDCSAICASDEKCVGATYKGTLGKCATFSGANIDATPSTNKEDYAIYNANIKLAKSLNRKLADLNRQIRVISKGSPNVNLDVDETELNAEEALLDIELQKRDDMWSAIQETTIETTMHQYWYWILTAGIILLIGVLIYIFAAPSKSSGPSAPDRFSSNSRRPSSTSSDFLSGFQRPSSSSSSYSPYSSSSSSSSYSPYSSSSSSPLNWYKGGLKPGKLKYEALIPAAVMLAATLTATQLQRFF